MLYQFSASCSEEGNTSKLVREWAINCYENPCRMSQLEFIDNDENLTLMKQEYLTRKYPYYVWHATKKYHQVPEKLEAAQDAEENKYISLYCSEYLHEAVTMIENLSEPKQQ